MSANLDKPLSELVDANKKRRGSGRGGNGNGRGAAPRRSGGGGAGAHSKAAALGQASLSQAAAQTANNRNRGPVVFPGRPIGGGPPVSGSKIIVSGLPNDVTQQQVKELFSTSIGPLKKVQMSYNAQGAPSGTVTVEFQRVEDANRAYKQYNNRLIDNKKPIKIEVVVDPAQAAALAAQQAALFQQQQQAQRPPRGAPSAPRGGAVGRAPGGSRGGARGGRRGGAGGGRGAPREPKVQKTVEDLDAEMEDYATKGSDAPAA